MMDWHYYKPSPNEPMSFFQALRKRFGFSYRNLWGIRILGSRKARKVGKEVIKKYASTFKRLAEM